MQDTQDISGYRYKDHSIPSLGYMLPPLRNILAAETGKTPTRIFELGCGKGDMAAALTADGHEVCGVDPSADGIRLAKQHFPHLKLASGSAYDDLASTYGTFPVVLSIDVVEYVYYPKHYAGTVYSLLQPGGLALISAPFHGYWKNIGVAVSGSMDRHFNSLQDFGRIKFWSIDTLGSLLRQAGFTSIRFERVGRIPPLAKAMIAIARK